MFVFLAVVHAVLVCLTYLGIFVVIMDSIGIGGSLVQQIDSFIDPVVMPFERLAQAVSLPPHFVVPLFVLAVVLIDRVVLTVMKFL